MNITVTMIFQKQTIQKLFIIRKLREAGLSLADIRAILHKPRTTPFYLHKQLNALQSQMLTIQQTISEMDRLSGQLPVCQSLDQLAGMLADTDHIISGICKHLCHSTCSTSQLQNQTIPDPVLSQCFYNIVCPFTIVYIIHENIINTGKSSI